MLQLQGDLTLVSIGAHVRDGGSAAGRDRLEEGFVVVGEEVAVSRCDEDKDAGEAPCDTEWYDSDPVRPDGVQPGS
jgi:hypothetical protein